MKELDAILKHIAEIERKSDERVKRKLDLLTTKRVAYRLAEFSGSCDACLDMLKDLESSLEEMAGSGVTLNKARIAAYKKSQEQYVQHLTKTHNLTKEGYYLAIYMSMGISLGVVFGLTVFDNIGLGIPIGMAMGIAIGASLEADAKKKGKVI
jgi:hypothetical protein